MTKYWGARFLGVKGSMPWQQGKPMLETRVVQRCRACGQQRSKVPGAKWPPEADNVGPCIWPDKWSQCWSMRDWIPDCVPTL